jgi:hypothetical protein
VEDVPHAFISCSGGGRCRGLFSTWIDKKEKKIFLIYKEIQSGAVAKSYMTDGLLRYGEITVDFLHILGSPS